MKANRAALAQAVDSVVDDRSDLDWGLLTIELDDDRDRELLRHIRLLSQISQVHSSEPDVVDERLLRANARAIVMRMPVDARPADARHRGRADASTMSDDAIEARAVVRWGRLDLLELVGHGTFGDVYRARDTQLQRQVAVKLLRVAGPHKTRVDRMLREARALARVHHPNVVVVHDAEERDGRVGLCMEFIRGRNLAQILESDGPRGAAEAAAIGQDVCQALAAVHAAGLLHRDVKAQNVMREDGGRIVLMDFGAGLPLVDTPARPGSIIGTPLYLAPEVLEYGQVSLRSDIYSIGVLLYHLVTNDYPVRGQNAAEILEAHRNGRAQRLRDVAPALPSWFVRVVEKATAADPEERFATVGELEAALVRTTPRRVWPLVVAALLTLGAALGVQYVWRAARAPAPTLPLVVLLPLDAGPGVEPQMASAFSDEIYQGLAMVDTLRVISQQSAVKLKADGLSMPKVAQTLGAAAVASGAVSRASEQYEVKLRVFLAGSDSPAWADTLAASSTALSTLRRAASLSIARAMKIDVPTRILSRFDRPAAASAEAYDAYARGRWLHARAGPQDLDQARAEFERTLLLEPTFAPAHAAMAHLALDLGSSGPSRWPQYAELARVAATRALALDPGLVEARAVLAEVAFQHDWNWAQADTLFRQAVALSNSYEFSRQRYAHFLAARGRVEEGLDAMFDAQRLDPYSDNTDLELVPMLQYAGRFAEAESIVLAVRDRAPNSTKVQVQLGRILAATGRFDEAAKEFGKVNPASVSPYIEAEIASARAAAGRIIEAEAMLEHLIGRANTEDVPPELFALVYARLGRTDAAFQQLDRAVDLKSRRVLWMKVDPRWDPLRADPRFNVLLKRLGF